jgi:hypothetical protein
MKKENKTELMVGISVRLSKPEAISFARSLPQSDNCYMVKISENPHAQHIAKRERFMAARYPRNGENVDDGHAMFVDSNGLESTGGRREETNLRFKLRVGEPTKTSSPYNQVPVLHQMPQVTPYPREFRCQC